MWRGYRNTGNIEDSNHYNEALNQAISEVSKSKRSLFCNSWYDIKDN